MRRAPNVAVRTGWYRYCGREYRDGIYRNARPMHVRPPIMGLMGLKYLCVCNTDNTRLK